MCISARLGTHLNLAPLVVVNPRAGAGRHLECGRYFQQLPSAADLHEYPLTVRTKQAQVAVDSGEHAVDADVPLGEHRVEYTAHPRRGGERGFIGCRMTAGAQQMTMGPQHPQFLGTQHHVTVSTAEKRQRLARLAALKMPPGARKQSLQGVPAQILNSQWLSIAEQGLQ